MARTERMERMLLVSFLVAAVAMTASTTATAQSLLNCVFDSTTDLTTGQTGRTTGTGQFSAVVTYGPLDGQVSIQATDFQCLYLGNATELQVDAACSVGLGAPGRTIDQRLVIDRLSGAMDVWFGFNGQWGLIHHGFCTVARPQF